MVLLFAENWRNITEVKHVVIPFNLHCSMVADVPDVFKSSWTISHFLFSYAHVN